MIAYRRDMGIDVRTRLLRDAFLVLACYLAIHAVQMAGATASAGTPTPTTSRGTAASTRRCPAPSTPTTTRPLFAQVTWPLTLLPWPVFCALLVGAAALGVAWLVRPLPLPTAVGAWLFCLPEILSGNVFWLLAVTAAVGFTRGSPWCVAAFTKILPCLGPVWFLVRREWRHLGRLRGHRALLCSRCRSPSAPSEWAVVGRVPAGQRRRLLRQGLPDAGRDLLPARRRGSPWRSCSWSCAARTDRAWLVPVAMVLASPVVGWGTFALLAAIPRLRRGGPRQATPTASPHHGEPASADP